MPLIYYSLVYRPFLADKKETPPFIHNALIRAVTVAMCAAMHHLMKMAANAPDTDSDGILPFYLFTRKRRRKRRYIFIANTTT